MHKNAQCFEDVSKVQMAVIKAKGILQCQKPPLLIWHTTSQAAWQWQSRSFDSSASTGTTPHHHANHVTPATK